MKNIEYCECCGAKLMARWERLSPLLVRCLVSLYIRVHEKGLNNVSISKELHLSKTEYNNFQKLRFHAMIAHVKDHPGNWLITKRGAQFLSGTISVPLKVKIFRNHIQEHSHEMVSLTDVIADQPYLDIREDFEYVAEEEVKETQPLTKKHKLVFDPIKNMYVEL
jgi:hypothetical protein